MPGLDLVENLSIVMIVIILGIGLKIFWEGILHDKERVDEAKARLPEVLPKISPSLRKEIVSQLASHKPVRLDPETDQLILAFAAGYKAKDAAEWGPYFDQAIRKTPKNEVFRMLG